MTAGPSPMGRALLALASLLLNPMLVAGESAPAPANRCPLRPPPDIGPRPLILGHRGASFHLPEHTLPTYRLAFELGADYVEPDLVPTKDGVLVVMHSVDLNVTSNVHTHNNGEFRERARQSAANNNRWAYYVHDFTWEEVQRLRVRQRVSDSGARTDAYDDRFGIPSFGQIVELLHDWNTRELPLIGRPESKVRGVPGIFAELKESQFFKDDADVDIADLFLDELAGHPRARDLLFDHKTLCGGLKHDEYRVPPLVVHSFNSDDLEYLRVKFKERWREFVEEDAMLSSGVVTSATAEEDEINHPWIPPLVWLVFASQCEKKTFWRDVAKFHISGVGVHKDWLLPSPSDIESNKKGAIEHAKVKAREWVAKAHSQHMAVTVWTARIEVESQMEASWNVGGVPGIFSSLGEELKYYFCELKIEGAWTEDIATALVASAEGCDGYASSDKEPNPNPEGGAPLCSAKPNRSVWLRGLSFLAVGALVGSVCTCLVPMALKNKGYSGIGAHPVALQLPEINTDIDDNEEMEVI